MKNISDKQHGSPSNIPAGGNVFEMMLEAMTVEELTDGLNEALESMTEETYDPALIDAYLAALDRKEPMPEVPDAKTSYANFRKRLLMTFPASRNKVFTSSRRVRRFGRVGLVAALTTVCLMGGMVVAQAAGVDVFGAMARWTDTVFSLGTISSTGAEDGTTSISPENTTDCTDKAVAYASLQEALDEYGIVEFSEPSWIPEGYTFENVEVDRWPYDGSLIALFAKYYDGTNYLQIEIACYQDDANEQLEKTNAPVESFIIDDFTVYLLENINSNSAAWATEHYECYISGPVEKRVLKQIVLSAYSNTQ